MRVKIWQLGNSGVQPEDSSIASWRRQHLDNNAHDGFKRRKTGEQKGQI